MHGLSYEGILCWQILANLLVFYIHYCIVYWKLLVQYLFKINYYTSMVAIKLYMNFVNHSRSDEINTKNSQDLKSPNSTSAITIGETLEYAGGIIAKFRDSLSKPEP